MTEAAHPHDAQVRHSSPGSDRLVGLVVAATGATVVILAYQLGLGALSRPGPGLWPCLAGLVMVLAGVGIAAGFGGQEPVDPFNRRTALVGVGLLTLGVYIVAFQALGFILPSLVMMLFWLRFLAHEPWRLTVILAVGLTTVSYLVFGVALSVPFPDDPVAALLGVGR